MKKLKKKKEKGWKVNSFVLVVDAWNLTEKIEVEVRISEMECQDWLEMSAMGKGGKSARAYVSSLLQEEVV